MSNYEHLTKSQLIEKIQELEGIKSAEKNKLDRLQSDIDILRGARKEDKEKLEKADFAINSAQLRETQLVEQFNMHKAIMRRDLDNQNTAMVSLFNMMDATINLQILYYNSFKNIFIGQVPKPTEE